MIKSEDRRRVGQARLLRRQGKTYAEIRAVIGEVGDDRLRGWLRGIPRPPETNLTGMGKPEVRRKARQLRGEGKTYDEIQALTGASRGSLSLWLRDMPYGLVARLDDQALVKQRVARFQETCAASRELRLARREEAVAQAAQAIGPITDRELMLIGAAIYWAEGAKSKPWRMTDRVTFINSDPSMISVFMAWLRMMSVPTSRCTFRVQIHESADVATAVRFWADHVGISADIIKTTLKRHNPKTVRRNIGELYCGCLIVDVKKSGELYRATEAAWRGIARGVNRLVEPHKLG